MPLTYPGLPFIEKVGRNHRPDIILASVFYTLLKTIHLRSLHIMNTRIIKYIGTGLFFMALLCLHTTLMAGNDGVVQEKQLKVYPQPANETITVELNATQAGQVTLQLCSLEGEVIMSETIFCEHPGNHRISFNIDRLPQGPYVLLDHDGSRRQSAQIIIVGP